METTQEPTTAQEQNTTDEKTTTEEKQGLTLNLLVEVKNILDVAITRGAFKPTELSAVGKVYDLYTKNLLLLQDEKK